MSSFSPEAQRQNIILVFITCGLLLFLGLTAREVSDSEALMAFRAKAASERSSWTDQSLTTPGGVAQATQAPLLVWAETMFIRTAGWTKPFMLRVWSVLCGVGVLLLVYRIASAHVSASEALVAPVLLAGSLAWNDLARSAMPHVPLVLFLLLAFVAVQEVLHARDTMQRSSWSVVYALAVGCSVLLDTVLGCASLLLALHAHRKGARSVVIAAGAGLLLAVPWFVNLILLHGSPALRAMLASSLLVHGADGFSLRAVPMHLVDMLASQPLVIIAIMGLVVSMGHRRAGEATMTVSDTKRLLRLWGMAGLIICCLPFHGTAGVAFVLPVFAILTVTERTAVLHAFSTTRILTAAFLFVILLVVLRVVDIIGSPDGTNAGSIVILLVASAVLIAAGMARLFPRQRQVRFNGFMIRQSRMLIPALLVVQCGWHNTSSIREPRDGAKEVAAWLEQSQQRLFTVVVRSENPSDTLVPQLSWYTQGWAGWTQSQPWRPAYGCTVIRLTGAAMADSVALAAAERRNEPIVYVRHSGDPYGYADPDFDRTPERKDTRRYVVYSRVAYATDEEEDD